MFVCARADKFDISTQIKAASAFHTVCTSCVSVFDILFHNLFIGGGGGQVCSQHIVIPAVALRLRDVLFRGVLCVLVAVFLRKRLLFLLLP